MCYIIYLILCRIGIVTTHKYNTKCQQTGLYTIYVCSLKPLRKGHFKLVKNITNCITKNILKKYYRNHKNIYH